MIRKSVAILAVLGLCGCGPEMDPAEGEEGVASSQSALLAEESGANLAVAGAVPQGPRPAPAVVPVLPAPPTLPLDPMPLTVVRPPNPQVQLAPAFVVPIQQK